MLGKEGSGKSALVNSLLGFNREDSRAAPESNLGYSATKSVDSYVEQRHGIEVKVYDTPGLGNERNAQMILDQVCKKTNDDVDVVLFCIALSRGMRIDDSYYKLISLLTRTFEQNFWKSTIFVLTFVNDPPYKEVSQRERHQLTIKNVKQELERAMKFANIDASIAESVPLVTAGYESGCLPHETGDWNETLFDACRQRERLRSVAPLLQRINRPKDRRLAIIGGSTVGGCLVGLLIGGLIYGGIGAVIFAILFGVCGGTVSSGFVWIKRKTSK